MLLSKIEVTVDRFTKMFNNGLLDLNGGKAVSWWIGQDGNFWVEHYFPSTYQRIANPSYKVKQ